MERVVGRDAGRETTSMVKVAFASFIGTAIEFYLTDLAEIRSEERELIADTGGQTIS